MGIGWSGRPRPSPHSLFSEPDLCIIKMIIGSMTIMTIMMISQLHHKIPYIKKAWVPRVQNPTFFSAEDEEPQFCTLLKDKISPLFPIIA